MSIQIEQLSEEEREEIINYGIRRSIVISISTIVTIMAGYLLGIVWQSIFFLFCFSALRKYAGGYHADTPIRYGTRAKKIALIYYVLYCILKKASIVYISTPIAVACSMVGISLIGGYIKYRKVAF